MTPQQLDLATLDPEQNVMDLGRIFAASGFFSDARDAGQAVVKILAGRELGLPPIAAMTGIYVVKGRVTLSSNIMGALIKRSGKYDYRVTEHSRVICQIVFVQLIKDVWEEVGVSEFSMDDAKAAGLAGGDNWKRYPRNMLFARALSNGAKFYCPDVFAEPVYTPDEIDDSIQYDAEGEVVGRPTEADVVTPAALPAPTRAKEDPPPAADGHTSGTMPRKGQAVTKAQMNKLLALASDLGIADTRKEEASAVLGRTIESFKDLSKQEAHVLIDTWQSKADQDAGPTETSSENDDGSTPHPLGAETVVAVGPEDGGSAGGEGEPDDNARGLGKANGGSDDDPSTPAPADHASEPPEADPIVNRDERFSTCDLAYLRSITDGTTKAPAKKRELAEAWLTYRLGQEDAS